MCVGKASLPPAIQVLPLLRSPQGDLHPAGLQRLHHRALDSPQPRGHGPPGRGDVGFIEFRNCRLFSRKISNVASNKHIQANVQPNKIMPA